MRFPSLFRARRQPTPVMWRAQVRARLIAQDHAGALVQTDHAHTRRDLSPASAERARVALRTALAAVLEASAVGRPVPDRAVDLAVAAARSRADFVPAAYLAARLLQARGDVTRAAVLLRAAWRARPHPALWLAWRDLRTDETPPERARRLAELLSHNAAVRESRILAVEVALIAHDLVAAGEAAERLADEPLTGRLADLHARLAFALGRSEAARQWQAWGATAPAEADWSDIGPDGRAFAYASGDWADLTIAYAETGELIHPRHARGEAAFGALPRAPVGYAESRPFVAGDAWRMALESGGAAAEDEAFGEALQPPGHADGGRRGLGEGRKER